MSNHDDFWTTLATGHSNTVLAGAMDSHLTGKSLDGSFGSVRTLTDRHRAANALDLPVTAGTKVVFAGGLGAYMTYDDVPADGIIGEVVTVRSATGEITHHDGKVFVKWADGKFRPIHAEHLRLVTSGKTAMEHASEDALKKWFKDHPNMTDKQKSKHTVSKSEGGETPEDAADQILGEDIKALPKPDDLKRGDFDTYGSASANQNAFNAVLDVLDKARGGSLLDTFDAINAAMKEADDDDDRPALRALENLGRAVTKETGFYFKGGEVKRSGKKGSLTRDPEDKKIMDHFGQGELHELSDVANDKTASIRVASLGDLTQFLKRADGKLIHKSTDDLWSYSKDADGNFLVSRLFDDEGEPLKA